MLRSLVKQELFSFNTFISTKYIPLYFTNILQGISIGLHDKIILNILSKACVAIYSEKITSETPNVGLKLLPGLLQQEDEATAMVVLLPVVSLQQDRCIMK